MSHAVVRRYVGAFRDRKRTPCRNYPVAGNDHCAVVQRGILEEQVGDEASVYGCVDPVSGINDVVKRSLVLQYDKRSGLVFRHPSASFREVVHGLASRHSCASLAKNHVYYLTSSGVVHIPVSEADEELSDFGLEYHDQCKHSDVEQCLHKGCHQPHVERRYQHPDEVQGHYGHENAHGRRPPQPLEGEEDHQTQQEYVKDVRKRHLEKSEKR